MEHCHEVGLVVRYILKYNNYIQTAHGLEKQKMLILTINAINSYTVHISMAQKLALIDAWKLEYNSTS